MTTRVVTALLCVAGAWLLRTPLEATMIGHMLLQWPLLLGAGLLLVPSGWRASVEWNWMGVPGLLLASSALLVWMLPLMLDRAVDHQAADAAKCASLVVTGALARWSWQLASMPVRLFFAGNTLWMTATVGVVLQSARTQLCTSYLVNDQRWTGLAFVVLSAALVVIGGVPLLRRSGVLDPTEERRPRVLRSGAERTTAEVTSSQ